MINQLGMLKKNLLHSFSYKTHSVRSLAPHPFDVHGCSNKQSSHIWLQRRFSIDDFSFSMKSPIHDRNISAQGEIHRSIVRNWNLFVVLQFMSVCSTRYARNLHDFIEFALKVEQKSVAEKGNEISGSTRLIVYYRNFPFESPGWRLGHRVRSL